MTTKQLTASEREELEHLRRTIAPIVTAMSEQVPLGFARPESTDRWPVSLTSDTLFRLCETQMFALREGREE